MADYYRSKEVYKQHRNLDHESTIIPVRGLYVSGTHLEAVYEDHVITVTGFTSSPLEFYDYTTKTINMQTESAYRILDVLCADDGVTMVDQIQTNQSFGRESVITVLDFTSNDLTISEG